MIPKVVKVSTARAKEKYLNTAKEDPLTAPTHVIYKGDELVGKWNLAEVPLVLVWHHEQKVKAKDSLILNSLQESIMSEKGINEYYIVVNEESPYTDHLSRLGFEPIHTTKIYKKKLKVE